MSPAGIGEYGGQCFRTACRRSGAVYFNHSTKQHYCRACAMRINEMNKHDPYVQKLGHDLCTLVMPKRTPDPSRPWIISTTILGQRPNIERVRTVSLHRQINARDRLHAGEVHEATWPDDSIDLIETKEEYCLRTGDFNLRSVRKEDTNIGVKQMKPRNGFTLIELLIVVAIVAIAIAIVLGTLKDHMTAQQKAPAPADETTLGVQCIKGQLVLTDTKGSAVLKDENGQPETCSG